MFNQQPAFGKLIVIFLVFAGLIGYGFFYLTSPKLNYTLNQLPKDSEPQQSLQITKKPTSIEFSVKFVGGGGSYDKAYLESPVKITRDYPFVDYPEELVITLRDADETAQKLEVLYSFEGRIFNTSSKMKKLKIQDPSGQLIDEIVL